MKLINTTQAAEKLGVSSRRVRALIAAGTLRAQQLGREYVIEESALAEVVVYGKAGRPKTVATSDPEWSERQQKKRAKKKRIKVKIKA